MSELAATFRRPFTEQVAAFRLRLGNLVPTSVWDDLWKSQHDRGFMVAGATKAALLADLAAAVDKAISQGTSLEEFRRDFRAIVQKHGWHGWTGEGSESGEAWRTRVIYRTNMATSYAAGRMAQLKAGGFAFWVYRHGAAVEPRLQHLAWDRVALPSDHPFWATHAPPNGWGCTCYVIGADTPAGVRRVGGDPDKELPDDWRMSDSRTGEPIGIDRGWGYSPGASVTQTVSLAAKKIASLPPELGSDFGAGMGGIIDRHWPTWLADVEAGATHDAALAGVMTPELIDVLKAQGIAPASAEIMVKPGLIKGPKADRHGKVGDALTQEQWLALPALLRRPDAALLDRRSGRILLVGGGTDRVPQLAVALDYRLRVARQTTTANLVVSAYRPALTDILGRIGQGLLQIIMGEVG